MNLECTICFSPETTLPSYWPVIIVPIGKQGDDFNIPAL